MKIRRQLFVELCSELTGYSCFELEATGLVDAHQRQLEEVLGSTLTDRWYELAETALAGEAADREGRIRELLLPPAKFWPVVSSLLSLWYLGIWNRLPDTWYVAEGVPVPGPDSVGRTHVPSALAYVEQLSFRAAHAHPPAAKPTGWGSWSRVPGQ